MPEIFALGDHVWLHAAECRALITGTQMNRNGEVIYHLRLAGSNGGRTPVRATARLRDLAVWPPEPVEPDLFETVTEEVPA
jgi:hypothetical protein